MGLGKSRLERFRASKPASRRRTFNSSDCSSSSQLETAWAGGGGGNQELEFGRLVLRLASCAGIPGSEHRKLRKPSENLRNELWVFLISWVSGLAPKVDSLRAS